MAELLIDRKICLIEKFVLVRACSSYLSFTQNQFQVSLSRRYSHLHCYTSNNAVQ